MASVCGSAWTTPRRLLRKPYLLPGSGRDENGEGVSLVTTYGAGQRVRHSLDDVDRQLVRKPYLLPGFGRDEDGVGVSLVTTYGYGQRVRHSLDDVNRRLLRKPSLLPRCLSEPE